MQGKATVDVLSFDNHTAMMCGLTTCKASVTEVLVEHGQSSLSVCRDVSRQTPNATCVEISNAAITPGHMSPATYIPDEQLQLVSRYIYVDGHMSPDTCCSFEIHVDCISAT